MSGPLLNVPARRRAGRWLLGLAATLALAALTRPLAPGVSPRARLVVTLLLGLGIGSSALLASLKGSRRSEQWAFYAFLILGLDGLAQMLAPLGWPTWPMLAVAVAALAVAEPAPAAWCFATLAAALALADAARSGFVQWQPALAACLGYAALVLALQTAQRFERARLAAALDEADRLRFGFDEAETGSEEPLGTTRLLRRVSEQGRRALQQERAAELEQLLEKLVRVARDSVKAHAVLFFDVDRERELARLRAVAGPPDGPKSGISVPLLQDPFAFVLDRGVSFYATDFKRLLWELPYYKPGTQIGTLLAMPVLIGSGVGAVLVADKLEIQAFHEPEPGILDGFAALCAQAIVASRAAVDREEMGLEFHAVYRVSERLTRATSADTVQRVLLDHARKLVEFLGAAFVMLDAARTRYKVVEAHGWAEPFKGREVGVTERTWAAWVLRGTDQSLLIDEIKGHAEKMPVLVLDEDETGAESLLIVPLRVGQGDVETYGPDDDAAEPGARAAPAAPGQAVRLIGAVVLTGKHGAFDATARRVLGLFANQAAATLHHIALKDREKLHAARDGLTGLRNRRAFDEQLQQQRAAEDRRGGQFALLLLDLDHFKRLNDSYGHPAGDAALRSAARTIERVIRGADVAARYGGEEFAVIMPSTGEAGALRTAERLRHAIEKERLVFEGARLEVTASIGVAEWPRHGAQDAELLAAADRALYAAKQAGRNRVVGASSLPPEPSPPPGDAPAPG